MRGAALLIAVALLVGACGGSRSAGATSGARAAADPCVTPTTAGTRPVRFTSGGRVRTAILDLPTAPAGRRIPVLLALHFASGSGAGMRTYSRLTPAARRAGLAVIYPSSLRAGEWHLRAGAPDDAAQIADLLDALPGVACVDPARVMATGVSNGAGMAARLACAIPDRLIGVAPVAPGLRAVAPCPRGRPLAILELHGLADQVVPYRGRGPGRAGAVRPWLRTWAARDGCAAVPAVSAPRRGVRELRWRGCAPGGSVRHLALAGTDHGWPGSGGPFPRRDPTGLSATDVVVAWAAGLSRSGA